MGATEVFSTSGRKTFPSLGKDVTFPSRRPEGRPRLTCGVSPTPDGGEGWGEAEQPKDPDYNHLVCQSGSEPRQSDDSSSPVRERRKD